MHNKISQKNVITNYYEQSLKALKYYIENHKKNPTEKNWDSYAMLNNYLSSKTLGYLSGTSFFKLCKQKRKEYNKTRKQKENN